MLVVVGGGCYGSFHARQLLKGVRAGRLSGHRVVVVDHSVGCSAAAEFAEAPEVSVVTADWQAFLRSWLADRASGAASVGVAAEVSEDDQVIPAPLAPHLLWEWLAGEVGAEREPAPGGWRLPYEAPGRAGERYLSAAGWTCPATCVEPAHCPALHAPRDWDLADAIEQRARDLSFWPVVFRCVHLAFGVGGIRAADLLAARDRARTAAAGGRPILVATSSRCHAVVGVLRIARTG
jgi:hypothetical protein